MQGKINVTNSGIKIDVVQLEAEVRLNVKLFVDQSHPERKLHTFDQTKTIIDQKDSSPGNVMQCSTFG